MAAGDANKLAGYDSTQVLKLANGVATAGSELNLGSWTELQNLIAGTSTLYTKPNSATFTSAPQWSGVPSAGSDLVNKTYVDAQVAAGLPNVGTAGTYVKVTTDSQGRVTAGGALILADIPSTSVSSLANTLVLRDGSAGLSAGLGSFTGLNVAVGGSLALNAPVGSVSLSAPASVTSYTLTLPSAAGTSGQVLTTTGGGILSWGAGGGGGLPATAGSAASPGYAFSGDPGTGVFSPAAHHIGFSSNGVEKVRIDNLGNVGVGVQAPASKLDVDGDVRVGSTGTACTNANKGAIRYNNAVNSLEYCEGTTWSQILSNSCSDATPNLFLFSDQVEKAILDRVTSEIIQISGINCAVPIRIWGEGNPEYRICSLPDCSGVSDNIWLSTPGSIDNGKYLQTRITTSAAGGGSSSSTIIIGSGATVWKTTTTGGDCTASPAIGTVCADGTVYAGTSSDGTVKMFTTRCDYGQTWSGSVCTGLRTPSSWNNGITPTILTNINSTVTGRANTTSLAALVSAESPYTAANNCANLTANGSSDWYLPSADEVYVLYQNRNQIGNFANNLSYWSSTEYNTQNGKLLVFADGSFAYGNKATSYQTRCVRR